MIPRELLEKLRRLLGRKARFRLILEAHDGKWRYWRIEEHDRIRVDTEEESPDNSVTQS